MGDDSALRRPQEIAREGGDGGLAYHFLGVIYELAHDYSNALVSFEQATEKADSEHNKIKNRVAAARSLYILGRQDEAISGLQKQAARTEDRELKVIEVISKVEKIANLGVKSGIPS